MSVRKFADLAAWVAPRPAGSFPTRRPSGNHGYPLRRANDGLAPHRRVPGPLGHQLWRSSCNRHRGLQRHVISRLRIATPQRSPPSVSLRGARQLRDHPPPAPEGLLPSRTITIRDHRPRTVRRVGTIPPRRGLVARQAPYASRSAIGYLPGRLLANLHRTVRTLPAATNQRPRSWAAIYEDCVLATRQRTAIVSGLFPATKLTKRRVRASACTWAPVRGQRRVFERRYRAHCACSNAAVEDFIRVHTQPLQLARPASAE